MHFGDSIFIFLLALVLFGPKKLPEIGRTLGKLLAEFRRASNEFKFQIQEELRNMEDDERRKKLAELEAQRAAAAPEATPASAPATANAATAPSILPPSTGTNVSTAAPYAVASEPAAQEVLASPADVLVEPPGPAYDSAGVHTQEEADRGSVIPIDPSPQPEPHADPQPAAPLDAKISTNGSHPPSAETPPLDPNDPVSSESLHHG